MREQSKYNFCIRCNRKWVTNLRILKMLLTHSIEVNPEEPPRNQASLEWSSISIYHLYSRGWIKGEPTQQGAFYFREKLTIWMSIEITKIYLGTINSFPSLCSRNRSHLMSMAFIFYWRISIIEALHKPHGTSCIWKLNVFINKWKGGVKKRHFKTVDQLSVIDKQEWHVMTSNFGIIIIPWQERKGTRDATLNNPKGISAWLLQTTVNIHVKAVRKLGS